MLKTLTLQNVGPYESAHFEFGKRINVIAGTLDTGKSFTLATCFWVITGMWPDERIALPLNKLQPATIAFKQKNKKTSTFDVDKQKWPRSSVSRITHDPIIYADVDGNFILKDAFRFLEFTPKDIANGIKDGNRVFCEGIIADWLNWELQAAVSPTDITPFSVFRELISVSRSSMWNPFTFKPARRVRATEITKFPIISTGHGDVSYRQWSSSMRKSLHFIYLFVWLWNEQVQAARITKTKPNRNLIVIMDSVDTYMPECNWPSLFAFLKCVEKLKLYDNIQVFVSIGNENVNSGYPDFAIQHDQIFGTYIDTTDKKVKVNRYTHIG